jgi:hypothetical protein
MLPAGRNACNVMPESSLLGKRLQPYEGQDIVREGAGIASVMAPAMLTCGSCAAQHSVLLS